MAKRVNRKALTCWITCSGSQPYRLAYWRVALDLINYRRFFSVNDLIGLRVEDPQVFEASHSLLFDLIREGKVSGRQD